MQWMWILKKSCFFAPDFIHNEIDASDFQISVTFPLILPLE